ncbi:MAG: helicase-related protein [Candidatus Anstonellales archaeon]
MSNMIGNIALRPYQKEIIDSIIKNGNTLVILPTGTGKTLIAFYVALEFMPCIMLAPTKPLTEQHYRNFMNFIKDKKNIRACIITGEIKREKRKELYAYDVIFATPQTLSNDLDLVDKNLIKLIIFDECHRAIGNYAYVKIANYFNQSLIIGLTASPGSDKERIYDIIKNLRIENIEIRTESQLKEFLASKDYEKVFVELPEEMKDIIKVLKNMAQTLKNKLNELGIYVPNKKSEFLAIGNKIMSSDSKYKFAAMPFYISLLHVMHMLELIETQGVNAFLSYANNLKEEKKFSIRKLVTDESFIYVLKKGHEAISRGIDHPKMLALLNLLKNFDKKKVIVFVQYTEQINKIVKFLQEHGINAKAFMGKKHGFNKDKQKEVMEQFREGLFDVLVSSSIGEEGIDIPEVNAVIFYEAVPSAIRSIQRKGRTGRVNAGHIIFLIAKGTRDESYFYAASAKERKMLAIINEIKDMLAKKRTTKKENKRINGSGKTQRTISEWF